MTISMPADTANATGIPLIEPDWPAPPSVGALSTTRVGGNSSGPWSSMNLGLNCGDDRIAVTRNRLDLSRMLPSAAHFLQQVHGNRVVQHPGPLAKLPHTAVEADSQWSSQASAVCAVLTADCLPVLFCNRTGTRVAAAHAGWRGLASGVLEHTIAAFDDRPGELLAWLGPAIGQASYEVGPDVFAAFTPQEAQGAQAFRPHGDRWLFDLYAMARHCLVKAGVERIYGGEFCTFSDSKRFFSYRRDGVTGRMASLVWLQPGGRQ